MCLWNRVYTAHTQLLCLVLEQSIIAQTHTLYMSLEQCIHTPHTIIICVLCWNRVYRPDTHFFMLEQSIHSPDTHIICLVLEHSIHSPNTHIICILCWNRVYTAQTHTLCVLCWNTNCTYPKQGWGFFCGILGCFFLYSL